MTDPPRHTCRGRPMICPGSCNPLRAHHQHHHHHHHRHRRQKYDTTSVTTSRKNISFLPDEFTPTLLKSLKSDTPVTSAISTDESISRTSSFARIALIKVSSAPKTPRPEETDIPAIMRKILSQRKLEMLGEPSTSEPPFLRKIDSIVPTRTISQPKETIMRIAAYRAPRTLKDVKCIVTKRLNGLTSKAVSSLFLYLIIFIIYAGFHVLLAVITWRTSAYQFFVSSQICGIIAFLMWRMTGTILI
ncbi:unnamed protein product [Lasius platythorax]|uniref:Uncharacterized protein n=1 Tax=Lasius platythorax TaxID=488582 RepID=A0AAV2P5Q1_9HYME